MATSETADTKRAVWLDRQERSMLRSLLGAEVRDMRESEVDEHEHARRPEALGERLQRIALCEDLVRRLSEPPQHKQDALWSLLHPADERDVPVPGFPTHEALVAWARLQPVDKITETALLVVKVGSFPQRLAAACLLSELGGSFTHEYKDDGMREQWRVTSPSGTSIIVDEMVAE